MKLTIENGTGYNLSLFVLEQQEYSINIQESLIDIQESLINIQESFR